VLELRLVRYSTIYDYSKFNTSTPIKQTGANKGIAQIPSIAPLYFVPLQKHRCRCQENYYFISWEWKGAHYLLLIPANRLLESTSLFNLN